MSRAPRPALSGSAGTGKTTLGRALSEHLGVPFLEEGMRARLEAGLDLHTLHGAALGELIQELWAEQEAAERAASAGFVADRSSLDYAAFWLHYGLYEDQDATRAFLERMARAARGYDRIALCPWGVLPLDADGVRSTNPWIQLRFHHIVAGLLERYAPAETLVRVPDHERFEERVAVLLQEL